MSMLDKTKLLSGVSDEWLNVLDNDLLDEIIEQLGDYKNCVPPEDKIFEFARLTPFSDIKAVVLGQDPYPKAGDAHGLAFSCLTNIPGSLRNIYKCLIDHSYLMRMPKTGDLTKWAEQGVLLLNCALTTKVKKPGKHLRIWEPYTNQLINKISRQKIKIVNEETKKKYIHRPVFMLWGNFAKNKKSHVYSKCHMLEYAHPSPLAQSRCSFKLCDHFIKVNKLLTKHKLPEIDWNPEETKSAVDYVLNMNERKTVIFTDGSCYPNNSSAESKGGYAASFALGVFQDTVLYGSIQNKPHHATNNRAEGMAIYKTLEYLKVNADEWDECVFICDTEFWIKMFEQYMPMWERRNIDFRSKKNPDMSIPMWKLYKSLTTEFDKEIEFRHIKSHNKDGWLSYPKQSYEYFCATNNNYIDELAGYARLKNTPGEDVIDVAEYDD